MSGADGLPTVGDIFENYQLIVDAYDIEFTGTRAFFPEEKIAGVLDEARAYEDEFASAAVLLRELPNRHVFEDGNKRTAWLTVVEYLDRCGQEPAPSGHEVERVLKSRKRFDVEEIGRWLETGEIDRRRLR